MGVSQRVLVTGATGFVAQHCILQLLEAGYDVRGTLRSLEREAHVRAILSPHLSPVVRSHLAQDLEFVETTLTSDGRLGGGGRGLSLRAARRQSLPFEPP
jgi:dihydroflavonol-4-reductase